MKNKKSNSGIIVLLIALVLTGLFLLDEYYREQDYLALDSMIYDTPYNNAIIKEDKQIYTYDDREYTSKFGIDISEHNGEIDFKKVRKAGVEFIFIRIGYRGYSIGEIHKDNRFEEYYANAVKNNIPVGIYFFSQAMNKEEALEEAEFVLKTLDDRKIDLPIVYDYEDAGEEEGRIFELTKEQRTDNAIAFMEYIKENHHDVMIYYNSYWARYYYDLDRLSEYPGWYAQYYKEPETLFPFNIWQYSESGTIDGISKPVDLNIWFIQKNAQQG